MIEQLCHLAVHDGTKRPVALATLLRLALDGAREHWRETPYGELLLSRFTPETDSPVPASEPEEPDPESHFYAWRCSWRALQTDSAEEEVLWLERAIEAFAAIEGSPRDPGNDLGPFTMIAHLLDVPQLQRAAASVSRMTSWPDFERSYAWAALAERFAELGELDAADSCVRAIGEADVKAIAAGCVAGERARRGHAPLATPLLPLPRYLDGITRRLQAPQQVHVETVWTWLANAPADEHALRALWPWVAFGASERWLALVVRASDEGQSCIDLLFQLATVSADPRVGERAARDALASDEPSQWLDELYEARQAFTLAAWRGSLASMLAAAARTPTVRTLGALARTQQLALLLDYAGVAPAIVLDVLLARDE